MFKAPFSFDGRIRRLEFGISYLIYVAFAIIISLLSEAMNDNPWILILYIPMIWFLWAQGAKRCHDRDNSGFYQIIPFYVFWMLFADGFHGINQYGPNPKGIGNFSELDQIGENLEG